MARCARIMHFARSWTRALCGYTHRIVVGERLPRIHSFDASGRERQRSRAPLPHACAVPPSTQTTSSGFPTDPPFREKRPAPARLEMLQCNLSEAADSVLAGSFYGWGDPLIPLFDLVVLLAVDSAVRLQCLRDREATR